MLPFLSSMPGFESICCATEDSEIEAFGVEFEEDDKGLPLEDLLEPAIFASLIPVESEASSKVS